MKKSLRGVPQKIVLFCGARGGGMMTPKPDTYLRKLQGTQVPLFS